MGIWNHLGSLSRWCGSKAVFDPIIEIMCDRDRVSVGRTTMCAAVVDIESVKLTDSDRFTPAVYDIESVNEIDSDNKTPSYVKLLGSTLSDGCHVPVFWLL